MPKPLTCFQLLSQIKKLVPKGNTRGAEILSYLESLGYMEQHLPGRFFLKPGVTLTSEDVSKIANDFINRKSSQTLS